MLVNKGMGDISSDITSQIGGAQDPCTAGGAFCPQPQSFGASFNPCCWSSPTSTFPAVNASGAIVGDNPLGVPDFVTSVPGWVWVGLALVGGVFFLKEMR